MKNRNNAWFLLVCYLLGIITIITIQIIVTNTNNANNSENENENGNIIKSFVYFASFMIGMDNNNNKIGHIN